MIVLKKAISASLILAVILVCRLNLAAQESRAPLSLEQIETTLREGVLSPGRVATIIRDQGINFEVTVEVRERLKKAGADAVVIQAVERAGVEYARKKIEKRPPNIRELLQIASQLAASQTDMQPLYAVARERVLGAVAEVQAMSGDTGGVTATLKQSRVNYPGSAVALRNIAKAQALSGDVQGALQTVAQIATSSSFLVLVRTGAMGAVAEALAKSGDKAGSAKIFKQIRELITGIPNQHGYDKVRALARFAEAQAMSSELPGARVALREAQEVAALQKDDMAWSLSEVGKAQAKVGDWIGALASFKRAYDTVAVLDDKSKKATSFRLIAVDQAEVGDIQGALRTLASLQVLPSGTRNLEDSNVRALSAIARAQIRKGDRGGAAVSLERAFQIARKMDEGNLKAGALVAIAEARAEAGDIEGALQIAAAIQSDPELMQFGFFLGFFRSIARALAEGGDVQIALAWANKRTSPYEKVMALVGVAEGTLKRTEADKPHAKR